MEMDYNWHSHMLADLQSTDIKQEEETDLPECLTHLSHPSFSPAAPCGQADRPFTQDSSGIVKTERDTFCPSNKDCDEESVVNGKIKSVQLEAMGILTQEPNQPVTPTSYRRTRGKEVNTAAINHVTKTVHTAGVSKNDVLKFESDGGRGSCNHSRGVRKRRMKENWKKSVGGKVKSKRSNRTVTELGVDLGEKSEESSLVLSNHAEEEVLGGKREVSRRGRKVKKTDEGKDRRIKAGSRSSQKTITENLVDLKVHFVTPVGHSATADSSILRARKSSQVRPTKRKKPDSSPSGRQDKPYQVELRGDVLEQWRSIGNEKNLSTDLGIAAFLVKHYLETGEQQCPTCCSPLRLLCSECPPRPPPSPPVTPVATSSLPGTAPVHPPPPPPLSPPAASPQAAESPDTSDAEEDDEAESLPALPTQISKELPRKLRKSNGKGRSHVCPQCGAQFVRSGGLKVHMRIHTGEKPYVCGECGQAFSQSGQLTVHMRKHKGERPFTCAVCPASFPLAGSLKQHMRVHTGDRPYPCPHCPRRFSYAGDLTVHLRKHTGDRPFLCSDCGKSFAVSSDLSKHKKIHSDHRPFKCSVCHKGFPFLNRLTLHMRTHTGDKPFLCADCGSSFSRASNLTVHRRVHHTFEKPFVCPFCQHAFADSANLSKHKKNKHGKLCSDPQQTTTAVPSPPQLPEQLAYSQIVQTPSVPHDNGVGLAGDARTCLGSDVQSSVLENGRGVFHGMALEESGTAESGAGGRQAGIMGVGDVGEAEGGGLLPFYNYYYHHEQQQPLPLPVGHQF